MFPRDVVAPRYESNDLAVNATKSTAYVPKGAVESASSGDALKNWDTRKVGWLKHVKTIII
jgi:hypothetical protein